MSLQLKVSSKYEHLFPSPTEQEYKALKESIREEGRLLEPISCLKDGTIVDGHTRFKIIKELRNEGLTIKPDYEIVTPADPRRYIWDENAMRRHLSVGQRGMLAFDIFGSNALADEQLADKAGISKRTMQMVRAISEHGNKTMRDAVRSGVTTVNAAFLTVKPTSLEHAKPDMVNLNAQLEVLRGIGHGAACPHCGSKDLTWKCKDGLSLRESATELANKITGRNKRADKELSSKERALFGKVKSLIGAAYSGKKGKLGSPRTRASL